MKILVPIKRVVDYNVKVRPLDSGKAVDLNNLKMAMNPFCEIAVEEAIRIKEAGQADEIVVVSIGVAKAQEQIRAAMAMGADRGVLIQAENELEPLAVAKLLFEIAKKEEPDLIILGKQSIDGDNNQTGQMLASLLDVGQATFASKVELDGNAVNVTREIDGGLETIKVTMPAVITTDLRLNEPRFASLPNIMKAKNKPLEIVDASSLGVDISPRTTVIEVAAPPQREAGIKVATVADLVDKLKHDAKVIS